MFSIEFSPRDPPHPLPLVVRWTQVNREALQKQGSSLEFRLHRLHFIELVKEGGERQFDALRYAKNFAPFAATHAKGAYVFINMLAVVPHHVSGPV